MKLIKLSRKAVISRQVDTIVGCEDSVVYEQIYVNAERIESFFWAGNSYVKMTSGECIEVSETEEEIIESLRHENVITLPKLPELGANTDWYRGYAAGSEDMRKGCANSILSAGTKVRYADETNVPSQG